MNKEVTELQKILDLKVALYNKPNFIPLDPISIPHGFSKKQDIEIAGLFAAILAWGNRKSIINSCNLLMQLMNNSPYDFIMNTHKTQEFVKFKKFVHRTFNHLDLWHIVNFLQHHYYILKEKSLETAFTKSLKPTDETIEQALIGFHEYVFGYDNGAVEEKHCRKHIATPKRKSACKRLNMYLRWMVRSNENNVDFGIWKNIKPSQLICPLDVHVSRVARKLGLLQRKQDDWLAALELTNNLKKFDVKDPVKYDFALFGLGVMERF